MKALIVDDSKNDRMLLSKMLRTQGYEVKDASNGAEALELVEKGTPEIIVSDISMPVMDGFTLLKNHKAIVKSSNKDELLKEVCRIAVEYGTFQMAWIGFIDEKTNFINSAMYSGVEEGYFSKTKRISVEDVHYVCDDIEKDLRMALWREEALKRGYRSSISLPIKHSGKVIGTFTLYASVPHFFDMEEINLLAESALLESEERYRTLYDSSSDAIMLLDEKGFLDCNNATLRIFGFSTKEDFTKMHPSQVSPEYQPDGVDSMTAANNKIAEAFRTGTNHFEWVHRRLNGEDFPADVLLSAFNSKGKQVLQATVRDISEQKRIAQELRLARDEAVRASTVKSEFLATMSHELRTPLTAIMGFSELLKMKEIGELNEKQERYINNICKSGKHLLGIINDILELVNVESGEKLPLTIESFPAPKAIDETLIFVCQKAVQKHIELKKEIDPGIDVIYADKLRFKQILLNLLDNAIKFSKPEGGTVTIKARKSDGFAQFSISDTGIGIKEEDKNNLFELFHQIDSGINRRYGGAGVGLAIVKQLVEQHGGRIWVESSYGEGTVFTFTLPLVEKKGG